MDAVMVWIFCSSLYIFSPVDIKVVIKAIKHTRSYSLLQNSLLSVADLPLTERNFFITVHQLSELSNLKMITEMRISQIICHFQRETINKLIILLIPDTLKLSYVISFLFSLPVCYLIELGFPTLKPPVCLEALGMQNKQIPDSAITTSSYWHSQTKANNGRLHFLRTSNRWGGWVAKRNDNNPFFQVHFDSWRKVTRVAIQGRQDSDQWVESFSLSYGYESMSFQEYKEQGVKKVSKRMTNKILF